MCSTSGCVAPESASSFALAKGDNIVEESIRRTNNEDEKRPIHLFIVIACPLEGDLNFYRRLLTSMERRSYVVVTMRLTVQTLFACILTLILSSYAVSGSTSYDVKKALIMMPMHSPRLEMYEGKMYESTGLYGQSQLRQISPADGSLIMSVDLPSTVFGEGLTVIDERILVLTWKSGLILEYSRNNFSSLGLPLGRRGMGNLLVQ